jgi:hypothetical protein
MRFARPHVEAPRKAQKFKLCTTDCSNHWGARRISAWAALYVAEGDRIGHDASADIPLMRIAL